MRPEPTNVLPAPARTMWLAESAILTLFLSAAAVTLGRHDIVPSAAVVAFVIVRLVYGSVMPVLRHRRWRWGLGEHEHELEPPPRRALRRFVLDQMVTGAVAGGAIAHFVPAAWPAAPALVLLGLANGLRDYRAAGMRLAGEIVVVREARLARRTLLARRHRLQDYALVRTPLQTRARLADLSVTVGSGGSGRVRNIEAATAEAACAALRR